MSVIHLKGRPIHTTGELPHLGTLAADFEFTTPELNDVSLYSVKARRKLLNIFPSVDTGTCAMSVRQFNKHASEIEDTKIICLSMDLPFAHERFCGAEGIDNVLMGSLFRSTFKGRYGLEIVDGPLRGLLSRAVIILGSENEVIYTEQVSEIVDEPNYDLALEVLQRD